MEKDFGINNKVDLYKRLAPALNCKTRELSKMNIKAKKEEIWNYLVKIKWNNVKGLELSQMVDDILNLDNSELIDYFKEKKETTNKVENINEQEIELL